MNSRFFVFIWDTMKEEILPIRFHEHAQLQSFGVNSSSIGFNTVTMESEKYICVRDKIGDQSQLIIIDVENQDNVTRRTMSADSAIMNPSTQIIALKAGRLLQIFDLESKSKLKAHTVSHDVVFWKWIGDDTIGIVTSVSVYHWSMKGDSYPIKIFDRHSELDGTQIISYKVSPDEKWMLLVGISSEQGKVHGSMQLYSKERNSSQSIEGHAGAFSELSIVTFDNPQPTVVKVFSFATRTYGDPSGRKGPSSKLHIIEIDHQQGVPHVFIKRAVDIFFPSEAENDFPVVLQIGRKNGVIFLVTKYGFLHIYDLETGTCLYMNRISSETIFVATEYKKTGGMIGINRKGQVLSISLDEKTFIPYLRSVSMDADMIVKMAIKGGFLGAEDLFSARFTSFLSSGQNMNAAIIAALSPGTELRTSETIQKLKSVSLNVASRQSPILQYFGILLERGNLNRFESIEIVKPVISQGKKNLLEKWLREEKLECSEELGDLVYGSDTTLALSIYLRADVPNKVVQCFLSQGQFDKIPIYAKKAGYSVDYLQIFKQLVKQNPENSLSLAHMLCDPSFSHGGGKQEGESLLSIQQVSDVYISNNCISQLTSFLLDVLKDDLPEHAHLQTRLLELNLLHSPQVGDAILGNGVFSHYDKSSIASLCENAHLYQRALEHYTTPRDIQRVISHAYLMDQEWLVEHFSRFSEEDALVYLREMLATGIQQNTQLAVRIATEYSSKYSVDVLVDTFENFKNYEGLYLYLGSIINTSTDSNVHLKYIQAGCRVDQFQEVERVCRESNYYDPEEVKTFLKSSKVGSQLPLIIVCDRFDFISDLVIHLYHNNLQKYIEIYVQKINPSRTPKVVGILLDLDCDEDIIKNLLMSVYSPNFSVSELVEEVEQRNKLHVILPWLEGRLKENTTDKDVFNALAKINIDSNTGESFLRENDLYDPIVVGRYCELKDPSLALIVYENAQCDAEYISFTNKNSLFKQQARYLVKRKSEELWSDVLSVENSHRKNLIDQVTSTALPESKNSEEVFVCVKSFMNSGLPFELIDLLEKIVLEASAFGDNRNLQNLLILTSIKADPTRVQHYISRLSKYDYKEIAKAAISHELYNEALSTYQKFEDHESAMDVITKYLKSMEKAYEYSEKIPTSPVLSKLGSFQLESNDIDGAVESYLKANNFEDYRRVIEISESLGKFSTLVRYLSVAQNYVHEGIVYEYILFCHAVLQNDNEFETMIRSDKMDVLSVGKVGDKCFKAGLYKFAKICYISTNNYSKLAISLIRNKEYKLAIEYSKKANNTNIWKEILIACLENKEFRLAQVCGLNLIIYPEETVNLCSLYENNGHFKEVIQLFESGLLLERVHVGVYTELSILYSKYSPSKLMEHLKIYWSKINLPKVIKVVSENAQWNELVFLYMNYEEYDNSLMVMMEHSPVAFNHETFKCVLLKVSNTEICYKTLRFYLDENPLLLCDLLISGSSKFDPVRVAEIFTKNGHLPLIKRYMKSIQSQSDDQHINTFYNELLIDEENWESLEDSISQFSNFNTGKLLKKLAKKDGFECRKITAMLYAKSRRWKDAIDACLEQDLYLDAIVYAYKSRENSHVESLLTSFIREGKPEWFQAGIFVCFDIVRPEFIVDITWRYDRVSSTVPYLCQIIKNLNTRIDGLESRLEKLVVGYPSGSPSVPFASSPPLIANNNQDIFGKR